MLNLAYVLESSAREYPQKPAVILGPMRLTFADVDRMARQVARGLWAAGIRPGDKVALSCPNNPYFPIAYYGILKAGAVVVPLNVLFKRREIAYHLTDSEAKAYICFEGTETLPMAEEGWAGFNQVAGCKDFWIMTMAPGSASPIAGALTFGDLIQQPADFDTIQTAPDDTAVILYTSGTTGRPKGAELTHSNVSMNALMSKMLYGTGPEDVQMIVLPLFHSYGQVCQMNAGFLAGSTAVLVPRFDPDEALRNLQDENVTIFCGVPTMFWALLNHPNAEKYDLERIARTLRVCGSGGAGMPVEVLRGFEEKYKVQILEGYGLSETSPVATCNRQDRPRKVGSIGLPIWGVEVRVVDDDMNDVPIGEPGEIVIRGHNIMKGYYRRPVETDEAFRGGWFHSGDVGKKDEDGYFYVVDRTKDMILRGGFNVYPREVEEVLMTHPAVSLAAVVGVPDAMYGEEVKAFIVPTSWSNVTEQEIIAWAKKEMAGYKYPRYVEFRSALPMTATGKVLKTELRQEELAKYERERNAEPSAR
ncbi:MAG: long-chain fatty acid--CoA ligase [FCB group bacterium]|jgi:long-chain acyl-CoA synthetase|nr:long-chain fatty acid--CoA ligase [FCB group bacterium]